MNTVFKKGQYLFSIRLLASLSALTAYVLLSALNFYAFPAAYQLHSDQLNVVLSFVCFIAGMVFTPRVSGGSLQKILAVTACLLIFNVLMSLLIPVKAFTLLSSIGLLALYLPLFVFTGVLFSLIAALSSLVATKLVGES